jgi:hypothetical protein
VLVVVVGAASAFGTVRVFFGDEQHVEFNNFAFEGKRGALASGSCPLDSGDWCLSSPQPRTHLPPWLPRASMCESPGAGGLSE